MWRGAGASTSVHADKANILGDASGWLTSVGCMLRAACMGNAILLPISLPCHADASDDMMCTRSPASGPGHSRAEPLSACGRVHRPPAGLAVWSHCPSSQGQPDLRLPYPGCTPGCLWAGQLHRSGAPHLASDPPAHTGHGQGCSCGPHFRAYPISPAASMQGQTACCRINNLNHALFSPETRMHLHLSASCSPVDVSLPLVF